MPPFNIKRAVGLVSKADLYEKILSYLIGHQWGEQEDCGYYWIVSKHDDSAGDCFGVSSSHHHWLIWWSSGCVFSNCSLMSFLRRVVQKRKTGDQYYNGKYYQHEYVRNVSSFCGCMKIPPRELVIVQSYMCAAIVAVTAAFGKANEERMKKHIDTKEMETELGAMVDHSTDDEPIQVTLEFDVEVLRSLAELGAKADHSTDDEPIQITFEFDVEVLRSLAELGALTDHSTDDEPI